MSLTALVHQVVAHSQNEHSPGPAQPLPDGEVKESNEDTSQHNPEHPPPRSAYFKSPQNTPSTRTGPPRSLSFAYSLPGSPPRSRGNSKHENGDPLSPNDGYEFPFTSPDSDFRSALEWGSPTEQERKGKRRESRQEESWNPMRWFQESPKEEKPGFDLGNNEEEEADNDAVDEIRSPRSVKQLKSTSTDDGGTIRPKSGLRRAFSVPHTSPDSSKPSRARWGRLRSLIPHIISQEHGASAPGPSAVTSNQVNITDELITGGLSTLMLRLWFERDEKGHRRIPALFHRLRIRVSDSLHPMHGHKSVFRIECEYANGAARWVVYRQLRDFVSLHTHYTVSNVYNRNVDKMPEFPRTSTSGFFRICALCLTRTTGLPYFKFLKKEGRDIGQADFARLQRESLENYLIDLIRAVVSFMAPIFFSAIN